MRSLAGPLVKGGVFLVTTALATVLLGLAIANTGTGDDVGYTARFTDVTSVNPGDDVRMAGVRIGQVHEVRVVDRRLAEVRFTVAADRALTDASTVTVRYRNMIGQRYLAVDPGTGGEPLARGAVIPLERTRPALDLTAMFDGFRPLFQALDPDQVNQLSFEIVQVLQGEGGTVEELLRHTASLTATLANRDQVIGEVIGNLNRVLDTVNAKGDQFGELVTTVHQLVAGLAADAGPIGAAVDGLAELTTSTAGLLAEGRQPIRDGIAALDDLSGNLVDNTATFERFLDNLPVKFDRIGRLVSYGSWMNFYLCSATSDAPPAPGGPPVGIPVTQARCQR
ncbi:phospholipid/cholesterol/gamma-HCH transport system substrate-binding protein [Amycolatopsis arida]|uniref:Phospholipid/cholesterol/gamma-HCH transport system substrate-binding protein n=1 Tax=Amycolatopsis arida TaxID=587909 RepID=A0A1I5R0F1_9PSEU|nr:MlaD family protein [Amycolatopsis arida]TDX99023.1 phospholipid/cholesterol/gamma-HCH transport system substrate-binding protein [Amycolatopsis arida]SFP51827.1 phospholipid/cholesterol/gamma-HCH transport system substrate-binding protein [Amycolatopsis arida]